MIRPIRIVVPFRPFSPESELHKSLDGFDWIEALRMLVHSASVACKCEVHAITDVDTDLPVPTLKYATTQRRLMLWTLEVCAAYLESADCDADTIMLDVDQLIFGDLSKVFDRGADMGVLVRASEKHTQTDSGQPLLNGVQFWRGKRRKHIARFYRRALAIAQQLPEERIVWGADTDAVRQLIEPVQLGIVERSGLRVQMVDANAVLESFSTPHQQAIEEGRAPWPTRPVLDFRWKRKPWMPKAYKATMLAGAVA